MKMSRPRFSIVTFCFCIFMKEFVLVLTRTGKSSDFFNCNSRMKNVILDGNCNLYLDCISVFNPIVLKNMKKILCYEY